MGTSGSRHRPALAVAPGWVRATARGAAAAVVAGLASAVLTRALMRAVEVLTHGTPRFSLGGSLLIAVFYILCLLPGCVALAVAGRSVGWVLLAAGTLLLLFEAVVIGLQEAGDVTAMTTSRRVGLAGALLAMLLVYAAQVVTAARWALRSRSRAGTGD